MGFGLRQPAGSGGALHHRSRDDNALGDILPQGDEKLAREGDASALPWPDGAFDLVTSLEALEFFPRPRRALAEMTRVLRPGGTLVVSKYPDTWARTLPMKALTRRGMRRALERLGLGAIEFRDWQPGHYELVIAKKF